ncbi:MAG TPA: hypothetical protein VMV17_09200 [Streptosporangiaceae bacterium]|nr:hypothetical protein [Streptosporangiaceae bacterium]
MTKDALPRSEDVYRHLEDLRTRTYEGARDWPERVAVFRRAVGLLDPVVRAVLTEASREYLRGAGTVRHHTGEDRDGGVYARWELSWPQQRDAGAHDGGRVEPVQVMALFGRGSTHPHLRGAVAGMWPCQITSEADAQRQEPVVRAIVEAELHERIAQGSWRVIPAFAAAHPG